MLITSGFFCHDLPDWEGSSGFFLDFTDSFLISAIVFYRGIITNEVISAKA
jgi:hypothetical protein